MGIKEFLTGKKKEGKLDVPPAPPTAEELPEFPSAKEVNEPVKIPEIPSIEDIEQKAVEEVSEELEEREELVMKKPVFVTFESFRDMMDEVALVNNILKENGDTLTRVSEFKEDEDKEFKKWQAQFVDMQKKLIFADKTLFGK